MLNKIQRSVGPLKAAAQTLRNCAPALATASPGAARSIYSGRRETDESSTTSKKDPSIWERVKEAASISKEHAKAAMKNQAQAVEDLAVGEVGAGKVAKGHAVAAREDMSQ